MIATCWPTRFALIGVLWLGLPAAVLAQQGGEAEFYRAVYLQTQKHDPVGAAAGFEKVLAGGTIPEALRAEARRRLAECREDLAAVDLARLMPPESLGYFEMAEPGEHVARLAKMLGLCREVGGPTSDKPAKGTPLAPGLFLPDDFTISPALLEALKGFRGMAFALTGIKPQGGAEGVLVIHPGDAGLLRGVVGTAVQVLEPADPVAGFKVYAGQGQAWVVVTHRLIVISHSRDLLADTIARLTDRSASCLATQPDFQALQAERKGALLFGYVSGARMLPHLPVGHGKHEAAAARLLLDPEHLQAISLVLRMTEAGVEMRARVDLAEGHRCLAYGLIRTAPFTQRALKNVPTGVAAIAVLGLNPAGGSAEITGGSRETGGNPARGDPNRPTVHYLTAMDLGREIFANIQELAVFVTPTATRAGGPAIPDVGAVIIARDTAKSEALWTQLLSLPAVFGAPGSSPPREMTIEGRRGTAWEFPQVPPIALVRMDEGVLIAGTQAAVSAAIRAGVQDDGVGRDGAMRPLLDSLTPDSSKALLVHVGRSLPAVAELAPGRAANPLRTAGGLLSQLAVCLVTHEAPTQLVVQGRVTGLPDVPNVVRTLAQQRAQQHHQHGEAATTQPAHHAAGHDGTDPVAAGAQPAGR